MNTVYTVAFYDPGFLMVYNQKRKGWEMPGGKIEGGETVECAAEREYLEESGYRIDIISVKKMNGCHVCAALLGERTKEGEMLTKMFEELPDDLAFDREEYDGVLEWARSALRARNP